MRISFLKNAKKYKEDKKLSFQKSPRMDKTAFTLVWVWFLSPPTPVLSEHIFKIRLSCLKFCVLARLYWHHRSPFLTYLKTPNFLLVT